MQQRYGLILALLVGSIGLAVGQSLPYTIRQRAQIERTRQAIQQVQTENYTRAAAVATQRGRPIAGVNANGGVFRLHRITETGELLYLTTYSNARAAATTRTNSLYAGGALGVDLSGSSAAVQNRLGVWDGGRVRSSHAELAGRVTQVDSPGSTSVTDEHATHVSGTMMATGRNPTARGMAYRANIKAWDFNNDETEMSAAAADLLVSNHSYGAVGGWNLNGSRSGTVQWEWYGDTTISQTEDIKFGLYDADARTWDQITNNAPNYLIVKAVGNDHGPTGPAAGASYYLVNNGNRLSTQPRSDQSGYDQITTSGNAKNILSVGAISAISNGYNQPGDARAAGFSDWGPTDDGRIKPDIVGVGVSVFSLDSRNDSAYTTLSGTSMSTPNVSGSLLLLQEYYAQLNANRLLRASTLKGLALHTASEAGDAPGPDYRFGWGLLDAEKAARVIRNADRSNVLDERTLNQGDAYTLPVIASGRGPLVVTICWSDPEATATPTTRANLNNRTPKLVNDLDVRVADGTQTRLPWTLNPDQPAQAAVPGDNIRDNVEQVLIANPVAGKSYTITINHKATLRNSRQDYALVISGVGGTTYCASAATTSADSRIDRVQFGTINQAGSAGCTTAADNTTLAADVQAGQTLPLSVTVGSCGTARNTLVKAFVDWNLDGDFDDAGEAVATSGVLASGATFTGNVAVPTTITDGLFTRLRIVQVATDNPSDATPCGAYAVGETQDFTLHFVRPANDAGAVALVAPEANFCGQSGGGTVTVTVRNFGTANLTAIPVSVRIIDQNDAEVATLTGTSLPTAAFRDANVTLPLPTGISLQPGQTYRFVVTTRLPGDQVSTNDLVTQTRVTAPTPAAGTLSAQICGADGAVNLTNGGSGATAYWYDALAGGNLLAAGNQAQTTVRSPGNTYYVALNDFAGRLGPAAKSDFGGGSYAGNFGPSPLISTKVPLVLKSARIYTGNAGRLTFTVRRYDETVISTVTLDVPATRTLPQSATVANGQLADDPNDVGTEVALNLSIPQPGDYKVTIDYENGVSIFRSNTAVSGFPYSLSGIVSTKGSLFTRTAAQVDTITNGWYYLYNLQVGALGCAASQRTAVVAVSSAAPTATITPNGSASICQGGAVTLAAGSNTPGVAYQWLLNGRAIAGATAPTYQAAVGGDYAVRLLGACPTTSPSVGLTVRAAQVPVVTQDGFTLTSNAAGNQWLLNGVAIPNATGVTLIVTQTGRYSVRASVNGCGEAVSEEVFATILATEPVVTDDLLTIYPNPATRLITVEATAGDGPPPTLDLIDARGVVVQSTTMQLSGKLVTATLDVSALAGGTFFVRLSGDPGRTVRVRRFRKL